MVKRAVADLEELQIRKFQIDLQIGLRLQINSALKPPYSIWSCNRTHPLSFRSAIFWGLQISSGVATERPLVAQEN
jgi:hypothetical protein